MQSREQAERRVGALHRQVDVVGRGVDASDDHVLSLLQGLG